MTDTTEAANLAVVRRLCEQCGPIGAQDVPAGDRPIQIGRVRGEVAGR